MATRIQLEQDAMRYTQRGQLEKAIQAYTEIIRQDPKDRRIRQKIGELNLKLNRVPEAVRQLMETAEQAERDGQYRAAIAIYKMLLDVQPGDAELLGLQGECYRRAGHTPEAARLYEEAIQAYQSRRDYENAAAFAKRLFELRPTDFSLRFRAADLLAQGGFLDDARRAYQDLSGVLARRGDLSEVARVAEAILGLAADNDEFRLAAAEARLAMGDGERALEIVGPLFGKRPRDPKVLEVVVGGYLRTSQGTAARPLLLQLAEIYRAGGDVQGRAEALRRAVEAGESDPRVKAMLGDADSTVSRLRMKLVDHPVMSPATDAEVRAATRADVFLRYGFTARAETALRESLADIPRSVCLQARLVETLILLDRLDEAQGLIQYVFSWAHGQARAALSDRMVAIGGPRLVDPDDGAPPDLEPLDEMDVIDDDELVEDSDLESLGGLPGEGGAPPAERIQGSGASDGAFAPDVFDIPEELLSFDDFAVLSEESDVERGRRLLAEGDLDGASSALQAAYREDPGNEELLLAIAEVRRLQRDARQGGSRAEGAADRRRGPQAPPPPEPVVAPAPPSPEPAPASESLESALDRMLAEAPSHQASLEEAESLELIGLFDEAREMARDLPGLRARVIEARCLRQTGQESAAVSLLQDGLESASEDDAAFPSALFELSFLQTRQGRAKAALGLLEEIRESHPDWKVSEVEARMRSLRLLLARSS